MSARNGGREGATPDPPATPATPATPPRRVCFVTGTRAEFGLMRSTLAAVRDHPALELQVVATGMHLDPSRGRTLDAITAGGWRVDRVVDWPAGGEAAAALVARHTGAAMAGIASAISDMESEIVLVVGDRVEAFAAASAGHVAGRVVAHVHGGDRAQGQVDDALRHAVTKLSHLHFAATEGSANRIYKLGEERWRIHTVGAPGLDGIAAEAASADEVRAAGVAVAPGRFALVAYHPATPDEAAERRVAEAVWKSAAGAIHAAFPELDPSVRSTVTVYPNNDPGSAGIAADYDQWARMETYYGRPVSFVRDLPRRVFLGLVRDAAVMVGNSSAGVIEAASFGTPVVDVGGRQRGRERSGNVVHCVASPASVRRALGRALAAGRFDGPNVYGGDEAGGRIADVLATVPLDDRLRRKLIRY